MVLKLKKLLRLGLKEKIVCSSRNFCQGGPDNKKKSDIVFCSPHHSLQFMEGGGGGGGGGGHCILQR